jgi:hypothetical protein
MTQMADLERTLSRIHEALTTLGLRYHCTGGLVSSLYGEPRMTQDIDIVLRLTGATGEAERLVQALQKQFLLELALVDRAAAQQTMFQALDRETWIKVDFHVGEAVPGELDRSCLDEVLPGLVVPLVSREDAILSKLLWLKKGSEKSRRDAAMMLRSSESLNQVALDARADQLGIRDLLDEIRRVKE